MCICGECCAGGCMNVVDRWGTTKHYRPKESVGMWPWHSRKCFNLENVSVIFDMQDKLQLYPQSLMFTMRRFSGKQRCAQCGGLSAEGSRGPRWVQWQSLKMSKNADKGTRQGMIQKTPVRRPPREQFTLPGIGLPGLRPGGRPREGAWGRASGDQALVHGAWPGTARKRDIGPSSCRPTTHRRHCRDRVHCEQRAARSGGPGWLSLGYQDWQLEHGMSPLWCGRSLS